MVEIHPFLLFPGVSFHIRLCYKDMSYINSAWASESWVAGYTDVAGLIPAGTILCYSKGVTRLQPWHESLLYSTNQHLLSLLLPVSRNGKVHVNRESYWVRQLPSQGPSPEMVFQHSSARPQWWQNQVSTAKKMIFCVLNQVVFCA